MKEKGKVNVEKIKLSDVLAGLRAKIKKGNVPSLKYIKLSSRPEIKKAS
jgi:hypothetical protein